MYACIFWSLHGFTVLNTGDMTLALCRCLCFLNLATCSFSLSAQYTSSPAQNCILGIRRYFLNTIWFFWFSSRLKQFSFFSCVFQLYYAGVIDKKMKNIFVSSRVRTRLQERGGFSSYMLATAESTRPWIAYQPDTHNFIYAHSRLRSHSVVLLKQNRLFKCQH